MASPSTWIHAQLVLPAILRLRGEGAAFRYLRELESLQFSPQDDWRRRQAARLATALLRAVDEVPYYESQRGAADEIRRSSLDALARFPLLTKVELQDQFMRLASRRRPSRVTRKTTGGSTGQAVTVLKDRDALAHELAATWLAYGWFGVAVGDKAARFWGRPQALKRKLRNAAVRFAVRRVDFSAFAFDDGDLERYWQKCLRFRPRYFYGYVSMLEAFAAFVERKGYDGRRLGLQSIITTSEVLSEPQRQLLKDTFGAPVQNEYGCGEVGPIAYECEQGALHVTGENLVVELLTADGNAAGVGESGEVVVTDLNNAAMPLIRYRVGDFATWKGTCSCGRVWPAFEKIWGRAYDFILGPDGRRYHGEYIMYIFEDLRDSVGGVRQFQVTQESATDLTVAVVAPSGLDGKVGATIERLFRERLPGMQVRVVGVPAVERAASGKLRLIQNRFVNAQPGNAAR